MKKIDWKAKNRFWSKVHIGNDCWEWMAHTQFGYGCFWFNKTMVKAHRMSWIIKNGQIPKGICVLHKCDNPPCVNPSHLFLGTHKDNSKDCVEKGRHFIPNWKGEKHRNCKLTESKVKWIRSVYNKKNMNQYKIARKLGVGQSNINSILNNKTWTHIL